MTLGVYPSRRYPRSWITQRLLNRAPEWAHIRKCPVSVGSQLLNPLANDIQETIQQLTRERYNMFASTADLNEADIVYFLDLPQEMEFASEDNSMGVSTYTPPSIYATINGSEYQITQAENNDLETLIYDCIVSRIEDAEVSHVYDSIIPRTAIANIPSTTPNSIAVEGHLYITIEENDTWEARSVDRIYYPKCYITGVTRKGTSVKEAIPLRYNGTFKSINEWQEVESIFVSYVDSSAYLTVETFPFGRDGSLDTQNVLVPASGGERYLFIDLSSRSWGSTLVGKGFTVADLDIVRSGVDEKEVFYEMELLDSNGNNVELNGYVLKPNSRFMYAVDNNYFYVYDISLEYPNTQTLLGESPETKIDLDADRWINMRGDIATLRTRNNAVMDPPSRFRWHMLDPDGNEYYLDENGITWPTTTDAWIYNDRWEDGIFRDRSIPIEFTKNGVYIVTLEAQYWDDKYNLSSTLNTKYLFFVPSIRPEIQLALPTGLTQPEDICMDSDLNVWLKKYGSIHKLNIFHDYFLVDYQNKRIWCREQYPSIRVTV